MTKNKITEKIMKGGIIYSDELAKEFEVSHRSMVMFTSKLIDKISPYNTNAYFFKEDRVNAQKRKYFVYGMDPEGAILCIMSLKTKKAIRVQIELAEVLGCRLNTREFDE